MIDLYNSNILQKFLPAFYLGMIFLTTFVSISLPIDRAMGYFRFVSVFICVLMIGLIVGVSSFMAKRGFYPHVSMCIDVEEGKPCKWVD